MSKMLQFNEEAMRSLAKGIKTLAKAVKVTLGPKGRNVVIHKGFGTPLSTKDGVTVAKEISLKDKFENMGAQLVKEVASKTADVAGDGTTTAIVLAEAIFQLGLKSVASGTNAMSVKRGIDAAVQAMVNELSSMAQPVGTDSGTSAKIDDLENIATISANNDPEIGSIIAKAMEKVGKDGIITVAEAKGIETTLDVVEGMQFDKGYLSPYFITNAESMKVEFENALVFITDKKISTAKDIVPLLEAVNEKGARPLVIIAEDVDGEALATLVVNKLKAGLLVAAVKAPGFGDRKKAILQDIAAVTGAQFISEEVGLRLEDASIESFGSAKSVKIGKEETTIIGGTIGGHGNQKAIKERAALIKAEIATTSSSYEKEKLEERLARLVGGVGVINIGAATEAEMKEKKARVEDALHATRAAVAEGIVPGGGVALIRAVKALDTLNLLADEAIGVKIVRQAAFEPATAIANNCGKQGQLVAEKIYEAKGNIGYNGLSDEFCDLIKAGVIDPVLVTKTALINAASVASLLLTTACMITEKPKQQSAIGGAGMGGMGGMGMDDMGGF